MTRVYTESPVSLDSLDDHLKALLRLKLREWVHLSPWFRDIPSIDPYIYANTAVKPEMGEAEQKVYYDPVVTRRVEDCPRKKHSMGSRKRYTRPSLHLNRLY